MKKLAYALLLVMITSSVVIAQNYPFRNIAVLTGIGSTTGVADSVGVQCYITGTVFTQNFETGEVQLFISNDFDEMFIYNANTLNYMPTRGDSIQVFGTIGQANGMLRMDADSIALIAANTYEPVPTWTFNLNEFSESKLVELKGLSLTNATQWTGNGATFTVTATDGNNNFSIVIDETNPMSSQPAPPGDFDVIGVGTQWDIFQPYTGSYYLWPRDVSDFTQYPATPEVTFSSPTMTVDEGSGTHTMMLSIDPAASGNDTIFVAIGFASTAWDTIDFTTNPGTQDYIMSIPVSAGDAVASFDFTIVDDAVGEVDEDIRFVITGVTNGLEIGTPFFRDVTIEDNDVLISDIASMTQNNNNGTASSQGTWVQLTGVVQSVNFDDFYEFTIHDGTGGIAVLAQVATPNINYTVNMGDMVEVYGEVIQLWGYTFLEVENGGTINLVSTGHAVNTPTPVTVFDENSESEVVVFENVHVTDTLYQGADGLLVTISDGVNNNNIWIDDDTEVFTVGFNDQAQMMNIAGIGGQYDVFQPYNTGYYIQPRNLNDITYNVSTREQKAIDFNIYPNPTSDVLLIDVKAGRYQLTLTDVSGKQIWNKRYNPNETLDLTGLAKGIYFLTIFNEEVKGSKKIVIK